MNEQPSPIDDLYDYGWTDENANDLSDAEASDYRFIRNLLLATSAAIMFGLWYWAVS